MTTANPNLDFHLQAALQETDDETARYHIREALQLRLAEQTAAEPS